MAAEIAVTLVLSFVCGLLLRSLILAQTSSPGFRPAGALALELQLPSSRYRNSDADLQFSARLLENLRQQAGVKSVGAVIAHLQQEDAQKVGIRFPATLADRDGGPHVAVINEVLARRWWPEAPQLAVGHRLKFGGPYIDGPLYHIAGVVGSVNYAGLDAQPHSEVHVAFAQNASPAMVVMIHTDGHPARWIPVVRREISSIDHNVAIQTIRPCEQ